LHHQPDRVDECPAAESHPQPRPVPLRAGRAEGALPSRPEPGGIPQPQRGDPQRRVETGAPGVHDLLRRPDPDPMKTATITYTDDRPLPPVWRSWLGDLLGRPTGRCVLGCLMVRARHEVSKDAGLLALRHENAVLRRPSVSAVCSAVRWITK